MVDIIVYPVKFLISLFLNFARLFSYISYPPFANLDMCFGDIDPDLFKARML